MLKTTSSATENIVRRRRYGPKRVVVRKGHVGQSLYFIFSGAVSVVFDKEEASMFARPIEVSVLKKGEVFGVSYNENRLDSSSNHFFFQGTYILDTNEQSSYLEIL